MVLYFRLFVIPVGFKLGLADLAGLLVPLVMAERDMTLVGFYHVPVAPLIIGFSMLLVARRFAVLAIWAIGIVLAFCSSFFQVSPIIWLAFPVLCSSVIIGEGMQGLVLAGPADRKWVLATAMIMGALSAVHYCWRIDILKYLQAWGQIMRSCLWKPPQCTYSVRLQLPLFTLWHVRSFVFAGCGWLSCVRQWPSMYFWEQCLSSIRYSDLYKAKKFLFRFGRGRSGRPFA